MNNKNLDVANFFWGGELTSYEIANILSFKKNNFKVNVWSYEELDLPDGINLCDAGKIISKDYLSKFTQNLQKSNMSSFSNLFRYKLLIKESGWWFDSDCICLKSSKSFSELAKDKPFTLALENPSLVGSSVMYINDLNVLDELINETEQRIKNNNYKFYWGEIGPYLITDVFSDLNILDKVISSNYFFKIKPEKFKVLFDPNSLNFVQSELIDSFVCHTWNEMFRKHNIEKKILPPKNSYLSNHIKTYVNTQNMKHYGDFFNLRFNSIFKYFYKTISRIKTLI